MGSKQLLSHSRDSEKGKQMKIIRLSMAALMIGTLLTDVMADDGDVPKRSLKANRVLVYNVVPSEVDTLKDMLMEGEFYGRLRLNTFYWDWSEEPIAIINGTEEKLRKDNWSAGLGASLMYKSAYYHGIGFTLDGYTSQNPWHMDAEDVVYIKAGKDVLSRYDVWNSDDWHMNVLAQLFLEYKFAKSNFRFGRQKFESFLTKSNDTKMIPNTFEGYTLTSDYVHKTAIKLAYLTKQKLRDHTRFHDLITFKNSDGERWGNNDDAGVHRGLSYQNFENAGEETDHDLIVAEIWNQSIDNLKVMVNYTGVPDVLYDLTGEAHYTFKAGDFNIIPGIRYMYQFDNGGGDIGGASLTGVLANYSGGDDFGYDDPESLKSWLFAARVDLKSDAPWKVRLGYSKIADKADIVAPWRGFPTGGFTRAMGQYNWMANTTTFMLRGDYDFGKAGIVSGLTAMFRLAYEDYDDGKRGRLQSGQTINLQPTDRTVLHLDAIQKIAALPGLEARVRMAFVMADDDKVVTDSGTSTTDPSYNEYRFELNYLF